MLPLAPFRFVLHAYEFWSTHPLNSGEIYSHSLRNQNTAQAILYHLSTLTNN